MTRTQSETDADMQHAHEPERHVGFTGTQRGMTTIQAAKVAHLLSAYDWLHHGDCIGADEQVHQLARTECLYVEGHPPTVNDKRAFWQFDRTNPPKPYLARNHDIADATKRLIAAPGEMTEQLRSGTWATVRYARTVGKPVTIVFSDGSVRDE